MVRYYPHPLLCVGGGIPLQEKTQEKKEFFSIL
jgi:hypothetical protein